MVLGFEISFCKKNSLPLIPDLLIHERKPKEILCTRNDWEVCKSRGVWQRSSIPSLNGTHRFIYPGKAIWTKVLTFLYHCVRCVHRTQDAPFWTDWSAAADQRLQRRRKRRRKGEALWLTADPSRKAALLHFTDKAQQRHKTLKND